MAEQANSTVTVRANPHLRVRDAASAIQFYQRAFGATEVGRLTLPNGKIARAEFKIGDALFSLAEESPETGSPSPQTLGGSSVGIDLYVPDVDAVVKQAVAAGATLEWPVKDQFYGLRQGSLLDPFGHIWSISTPLEDISFDEMQRRFGELMKSGNAG